MFLIRLAGSLAFGHRIISYRMSGGELQLRQRFVPVCVSCIYITVCQAQSILVDTNDNNVQRHASHRVALKLNVMGSQKRSRVTYNWDQYTRRNNSPILINHLDD
jgi:hypothetical protein